ncbi:MAG TPA: type II secretion system F family protein [Chlorobaculum sp.]|nr:type II secretion system F family protein [Chlorobaculum sp.]
MTRFLISFFAFMAVMLIMLLLYGLWLLIFDSQKKAKKRRLQTIKSVVQSGTQSLGSSQGSSLEIWLRARFSIFEQLETQVKHAHSPLTALSLIGLMLGLFVVVMAFGFLRQSNPLLMLLLAFVIAGSPLMWLNHKSNKRSKAFGDKLPETLDFITRALRAGHSLTSAIGMVGKEFPDPIGQEFKTVFDEISFSIPFKDAIGHLADRVPSNDLNFFVISLMIQHETGGNLTELLEGLAKTMRERIKLRGKIRTLSSEGRTSAWVLGSMPFVFILLMTAISREYISLLWTTPQGQNLILIGSGLMIAGILMLNSIIKIKV